ncbi:MAG: Glycoprotein gp2, partial [Candidatus Jorgensenbacteria bacterium GW2011_GWA2_45_9]
DILFMMSIVSSSHSLVLDESRAPLIINPFYPTHIETKKGDQYFVVGFNKADYTPYYKKLLTHDEFTYLQKNIILFACSKNIQRVKHFANIMSMTKKDSIHGFKHYNMNIYVTNEELNDVEDEHSYSKVEKGLKSFQIPQGRMETGITVSDTNAPSNYMLFTVAAPVITNTYSGSTTKSGQSGDEVARFTISNPGTRDLSLSSTTITISLTPNGATSTVDTWRIYESGDLSNALDTDATSLASASATSTTITFDSFTTAQTVTAGGSKTYVIKANTASIKTITSTYTGDVKLSVKLDGSTGYLSTDVASSPSGEELLWNDGVVLYSYSTTGAYAATYSNLLGSDSGEVLGPTLTY